MPKSRTPKTSSPSHSLLSFFTKTASSNPNQRTPIASAKQAYSTELRSAGAEGHSSSKRKEIEDKDIRADGKKRRRIVIESSSDDESDNRSETKNKVAAVNGEQECPTPELSSTVSLTPKAARNMIPGTPRTPSSLLKSSCKITSRKVASPKNEATTPRLNGGNDASDPIQKHLTFEFLSAANIRDGSKRRPSDSEYDPSTLYVPDKFLKDCSPGLRQWWEIKQKNFDTIIFFKVGKFYELYHMDAVTAVRELNLVYMKGDFAHSGFPEIAYDRYCDQLVQKGYKVARVEQTETPQMMEQRRAAGNTPKGKASDKVVRREICRITTPATQTRTQLCSDVGESNSSGYLIAVCERDLSQCHQACTEETEYGVCAVDVSCNVVKISQFKDTSQSIRLRTLLAHFPPKQVLYPRNGLSSATKAALTLFKMEALSSKDFMSANETLKRLIQEGYFLDEDRKETVWPDVLKQMQSDTDSLGTTAKPNYDLCLRSFGGVISYLKKCLIDYEVLSQRNVEKYEPLDMENMTSATTAHTAKKMPVHMVLDSITLQNLDIICNSNQPNSIEGSLYERLNMCSTAFGHRLFRKWLCNPLCDIERIEERLDAVEFLINNKEFSDCAISLLRSMPDLEKLLQRMHSLSVAPKRKDHPDNRAILYESDTYEKRKAKDFIAGVEGFEKLASLLTLFQPYRCDCQSKLLKDCLTLSTEGGSFPEIQSCLQRLQANPMYAKLKKDGILTPERGLDPEYDKICDEIENIENQLEEYLEEVQTTLNTKGFKRYATARCVELVERLTGAEERGEVAKRGLTTKLFTSFAEDYKLWIDSVNKAAILDVLLSFSTFAQGFEADVCRPELVAPESCQKPFIDIRSGIHPCAIRLYTRGQFIPNDVQIGIPSDSKLSGEASVMLLSGPNMGGKSTLMRQTSLIVIMAQMGCFVPAQKCTLTPVDRLFTRIGARDRILAGQSTFFVEMSECSSICAHATPNSLIICDELGRGTATHDGTAIAASTLRFFAEDISARTIFSTHYHSLIEMFESHPRIRLTHMACKVENENLTDPTKEAVTFLYKLAEGPCPKSYGFHAALLAGISADIVKTAFEESQAFEKEFRAGRAVRKIAQMVEECSIEDIFVKLERILKEVKDIV